MDFMEFLMFFKENGSIDFHIDDSEGEVRQFIGEGWSIGKPNSESIKKTRARLRKVTEEIAYPDPGAAPKKKAKKAGVPHAVGELDSGVPESPAAPELFKYLADQAARSQGKGLIGTVLRAQQMQVDIDGVHHVPPAEVQGAREGLPREVHQEARAEGRLGAEGRV